jgi:hypothetical protein
MDTKSYNISYENERLDLEVDHLILMFDLLMLLMGAFYSITSPILEGKDNFYLINFF